MISGSGRLVVELNPAWLTRYGTLKVIGPDNIPPKKEDTKTQTNKKISSGDSSAISSFALLKFSDAAAYDHGAALIEVIHKIGSRKFINAITKISTPEKHKIEGYLDVGLMYGYRKEYENSRLKEVFPSIDSFLNSN